MGLLLSHKAYKYHFKFYDWNSDRLPKTYQLSEDVSDCWNCISLSWCSNRLLKIEARISPQAPICVNTNLSSGDLDKKNFLTFPQVVHGTLETNRLVRRCKELDAMKYQRRDWTITRISHSLAEEPPIGSQQDYPRVNGVSYQLTMIHCTPVNR